MVCSDMRVLARKHALLFYHQARPRCVECKLHASALPPQTHPIPNHHPLLPFYSPFILNSSPAPPIFPPSELLPQESYFGRDGKTDMFWPFVYDEDAIEDHCQSKFDVEPRFNWISTEYGGMAGVKEASNIVFSNGRYDPWRSGGVMLNVTERSIWSIDIFNGAHHVDLMFTTSMDTPDLTAARAFELARIKEWIAA